MFYSGKTDIGKVRSTNQDSFAIKSYSDGVLVAVVCDGMGGVQGGNIASETAVEYFFKSLESKSIINLEDGEKIPTNSLAAAALQASPKLSGSFLNFAKVSASALYRFISAAAGSSSLFSRPRSAA